MCLPFQRHLSDCKRLFFSEDTALGIWLGHDSNVSKSSIQSQRSEKNDHRIATLHCKNTGVKSNTEGVDFNTEAVF